MVLRSNNVGNKVWYIIDREKNRAEQRANPVQVIHTSNSLVEDSGRGTEVEGTTSWVNVATFAQVGQKLDFVSVEVAREVQLLAAHHDHLAALQQVLGDNGGQTAKQMAASIDNNGLQEKENNYNCRRTMCEVRVNDGHKQT